MATRALRDPDYERYAAGITVVDAHGAVERRPGSLVLPREHIVGAWCKVGALGVKSPAEVKEFPAAWPQLERLWGVAQEVLSKG